MQPRSPALSILAVSAAMLAACGGGGGGSAAPAPSTDPAAIFPLQTAKAARVNQGLSATLTCSGTVNGVPVTAGAQYIVSAATSVNFEGQAALANVQTLSGTITANGQSAPLGVMGTSYVSAADYRDLGYAGATYDVVTTPSTMSATAKLGDSGNDDYSSDYTDSSKSTLSGTESGTWSIQADTSRNTAILVVTGNSFNLSNVQTSSGTTRYRISTGGSLSLVGLVLGGSNSTLTCTAS